MYGVSERASLWILIPRVALGILVSTLLLFALFWLRFGEINTYIALIALLLTVFQILLVVGLRHQETLQASPARRPGRFDRLGSFWLVAVFFGSIFAWFTSDWADAYPEYAMPLRITTFLLSIVLPVITSIPNYRYIAAANAYITLPMLVAVTLIPSIVGWASIAALWSSIIN